MELKSTHAVVIIPLFRLSGCLLATRADDLVQDEQRQSYQDDGIVEAHGIPSIEDINRNVKELTAIIADLQQQVKAQSILLEKQKSAQRPERNGEESRISGKKRSRRSTGQRLSESDSADFDADHLHSRTPFFCGESTPSCLGLTGLPPGPPGPQGPPGFPGRDGRDGRDYCERMSYREADVSVSGDNAGSSNCSGSVVYIRWGRTNCPTTSDLVYSGVAGGSHVQEEGGGSNYLCLPEEPIYDEAAPGVSEYRGYVYGAEYQTGHFEAYRALVEHNVPCAVCKAWRRSSLLMIPARNVCPSSEWTLEYKGHLMSQKHDQSRTEYVCLDRDAEAVPGSGTNTNGVLFRPVEGRCLRGGLPCDRYIDGYELTCAVCTVC